MKEPWKRKWLVPVATLVLTLSIGSAAFAATGSSSTATTQSSTEATQSSTEATQSSTGATTPQTDSAGPWGHQRSDETLLTGDVKDQVQAAAVAKVGADATVVRVETDADGHAPYEVHMVNSDGTAVTVYVDESYQVVSVEEGGPGVCQHGGYHGAAQNEDSSAGSGTTSSTSTQSSSATSTLN